MKNPLMLLDEIDKVSSDYKGDTSSALLEVLDSEQNNKFRDHYVELPLDLSEVLFIATANDVADDSTASSGPYGAHRGFQLHGKREAAHCKRAPVSRNRSRKTASAAMIISITDKAMKKLISSYTREAGVRSLERKIGEICRKAAREFLEEGKGSIKVTETSLKNYLGKERYTVNRHERRR